MSMHERKTWLERLARSVEEDSALSWDWRLGSCGRDEEQPVVIVVPGQWACDAQDAIEMAERMWARGEEDFMAKDAEAP